MNDYSKKWNILKEKVKQDSEMKPCEFVTSGYGIRTAYRSVLKLMDMLENGDLLDDIVVDNGMFKKTINILEI